MKKLPLLFVIVCFVLSVCSCSNTKRYELMRSDSEIASIQIVNKTSGAYRNDTTVEYDVLCEINDKDAFLDELYKIGFNTYLIGVLPELDYGNVIRIEYKNSDVEYIGYDAQLKIAGGARYNGSRNCSKSEFDSLLSKYTGK